MIQACEHGVSLLMSGTKGWVLANPKSRSMQHSTHRRRVREDPCPSPFGPPQTSSGLEPKGGVAISETSSVFQPRHADGEHNAPRYPACPEGLCTQLRCGSNYLPLKNST